MDIADLRYDMTNTLKTFPLPLTRWEEWARRHAGADAKGAREEHGAPSARPLA